MAIALSGGTVVTSIQPPRLELADVVIEGSRIAAVGAAAPDGTPRLDCSGCLVIPGSVCAHTHLYAALVRGMPYHLPPPANFVQILQRVWWRLDRALDEESIRASALVGAIEALLAGTTTVADHHASPFAIDGSLDLVADALEEAGIRSVACYEVSDRDGQERAAAGIAENRRFLRTNGHPLVRGMIGAHASFTLSDETLGGCVEAARESGVGIHMHVAEDLADQADSRARFGKPVVDRLAEAGAVTHRSLLAHCVHVHPSEIGRILDLEPTVAHNARSNMHNAVGRAPVEALGDRVALGTDGIGADMFAESQAAYWRAREEGSGEAAPATMRRLAQGAAFAGRVFDEPALGRIEPGAPADLVVLDYEPPAPLTADGLAGHWLYALGSRHVRDVLVAGDVVVRDRRTTRVDQEKVAADAAGAAERLWRRTDAIGPHPFEPVTGS